MKVIKIAQKHILNIQVFLVKITYDLKIDPIVLEPPHVKFFFL